MNKSDKPVIIWLLTGAVLVFLMTAIGGITRLTDSGLSMVNWNLIMGSVPPMNEAEWKQTFDQYKAYPEYKMIHHNFNLDDFKSIFFWEYFHRMIGRLLGLVFIIPFAVFLYQKRFDKKRIVQLSVLLVLGGFQGFLGWYMVKSGLVHDPHVSHFRLAAHLLMAFTTISYTLWLVFDIQNMEKPKEIVSARMNRLGVLTFSLLVLQIMYGAFVAGKDAGMIHNYWPHMNPGEFISPVSFQLSPFWLNFIENSSGIQFFHRYLAYIVLSLIVMLWWKAGKEGVSGKLKNGYSTLAVLVGVQFILGVSTLLFHVPVVLALLHQLCALLLALNMVYIFSHQTTKG